MLVSPFEFKLKETKVTFSNDRVKKCSVKVLTHELEQLVLNGCTVLKVKDL